MSFSLKKIKITKEIIHIITKANNKELFFFFPYFHTGGAEIVHLDIVRFFDSYKKIIFFTADSYNNHFKNNFENEGKIVELQYLSNKKYKKIGFKIISKIINRKNNPIVFGCNSHFFYDLIPYFEPHVRVIDLIHAFSYELDVAAEKYSLPVAHRIDKRVVLGAKTYNDFEKLYQKNQISEELLNRIHIIKNSITVEESWSPKTDKPLKILFVGRNSSEKRPELFFKIAAETYKKNKEIKFLVIGDFDKEIYHGENVEIVGLIKEKNILNDYYRNSSLLLITSNREGFPMVILEGMSYGVVPISTNVGEIAAYINENDKTGIIINENFEESESALINEFVDKILFFDKNRSVLNNFSSQTYQCVSSNFSKTQQKVSYLDLFELG